jgi:hypothetical protein
MPQPHSPHSPFHDGFATLWQEPVLLASELTWRWCFGFAAWALAIIAAALFLDSIKISRLEQFLLSTPQLPLLREAVHRIFRGTLTRFVWEQATLVFGLALLWSLAATAGRAATLRRLVAMFSSEEEPEVMTWEFGSIFVLNLLRAMWSLIAFAAALCSLLLGSVMASHQRPLSAAFFLAFGIGLSVAIGAALSWFFGLAPLFCIRNGAGAMEALSQTVDFCSRRSGQLFGLGMGFRSLRLAWVVTMFFIGLAPLQLAGKIAPGWIMLILGVIALVYFAGADLLYLARLGAYASLAEDDAHPGRLEEVPPVGPPEVKAGSPLVEPERNEV